MGKQKIKKKELGGVIVERDTNKGDMLVTEVQAAKEEHELRRMIESRKRQLRIHDTHT